MNYHVYLNILYSEERIGRSIERNIALFRSIYIINISKIYHKI